MEIEIEYEHEAECPKCKNKFVVKGVATSDIEPQQNEAYD